MLDWSRKKGEEENEGRRMGGLDGSDKNELGFEGAGICCSLD